MNYQNPELRKRLADEYVFGMLIGRARLRFERLLDEDASLQEAVAQAEARWNSLAETVPPLQPPPYVWQGISQRLRFANNPRKSHRQPARVSAGLNFWRGWAIAATIALLAVIVDISYFPDSIESENFVVLVTEDKSSRASWVITADTVAKQISVKTLSPQPLHSDRVYQLWIKEWGVAKVHSVGLIPAQGDTTLTLQPTVLAMLTNAEKFGVSIEPPGGSPTGQPTTTPLYHGKILKL